MASLEQRLTEAMQAIGADHKSVQTAIGPLASLQTTNKSNVVAAINELSVNHLPRPIWHGNFVACWLRGNPDIAMSAMASNANFSLSPAHIGTSVARMVRFSVPQSMTVSKLHFFPLVQNFNGFNVRFYTRQGGSGFLAISETLQMMPFPAKTWSYTNFDAPMELLRNMDYYVAYTAANGSDMSGNVATLTPSLGGGIVNHPYLNNAGIFDPAFGAFAPDIRFSSLQNASVLPDEIWSTSTPTSWVGGIPALFLSRF